MAPSQRTNSTSCFGSLKIYSLPAHIKQSRLCCCKYAGSYTRAMQRPLLQAFISSQFKARMRPSYGGYCTALLCVSAPLPVSSASSPPKSRTPLWACKGIRNWKFLNLIYARYQETKWTVLEVMLTVFSELHWCTSPAAFCHAAKASQGNLQKNS